MLQGDFNTSLGKLTEAYEAYQQAKRLAEQAGESEDRKAEIFIRQQSIVHARGNNEEALCSRSLVTYPAPLLIGTS
jgi:malonyl CoA-acyl carrier protein transacylase